MMGIGAPVNKMLDLIVLAHGNSVNKELVGVLRLLCRDGTGRVHVENRFCELK